MSRGLPLPRPLRLPLPSYLPLRRSSSSASSRPSRSAAVAVSSVGSRCRSFGTESSPSASREIAAVRLQRMASTEARGIKISSGSRCRSVGIQGTLCVGRELAAVRLQRMISANASGIKNGSSDEATGIATPRRRAYALNHAAELLHKPEELGLRTGPPSRAAREARTGNAIQCTAV